MSERIVVVGGGVGGLATALAFARSGHRVTVLERDLVQATTGADEAFQIERRGAPQSHQTHGFLARIVVELRRRFPDVLDALLDAGCFTLPLTPNLGEPQPGDEDLRVLIVRRTTFEWVLRRSVEAEPGIELISGVAASGLVGSEDSPRPVVRGVRLDGGQVVPAGLVVMAAGRRDVLPRWIADLGAEIPERVVESGLVYLTRWFRRPETGTDNLDPKLGGDLGFVKYLAVPGDSGTLSVTLAVPSTDGQLRSALASPDSFESACRLLPGPNQFFRSGPLEPIGGVRPMGGLINRSRSFTDSDGEPRVLGLHAVGDAHTCTNPLYGRGCSLAVVQALLLADAAAAHPGDPVARAGTYEEACRREVLPWFDVSVHMDALGADPSGLPFGSRRDGRGKGLAALLVAAGTDPVIGRAMARFWNLLATPRDLMADSGLVERVAAVMADPDAHPLPPREGPTRAGLLEELAA